MAAYSAHSERDAIAHARQEAVIERFLSRERRSPPCPVDDDKYYIEPYHISAIPTPRQLKAAEERRRQWRFTFDAVEWLNK